MRVRVLVLSECAWKLEWALPFAEERKKYRREIGRQPFLLHQRPLHEFPPTSPSPPAHQPGQEEEQGVRVRHRGKKEICCPRGTKKVKRKKKVGRVKVGRKEEVSHDLIFPCDHICKYEEDCMCLSSPSVGGEGVARCTEKLREFLFSAVRRLLHREIASTTTYSSSSFFSATR